MKKKYFRTGLILLLTVCLICPAGVWKGCYVSGDEKIFIEQRDGTDEESSTDGDSSGSESQGSDEAGKDTSAEGTDSKAENPAGDNGSDSEEPAGDNGSDNEEPAGDNGSDNEEPAGDNSSDIKTYSVSTTVLSGEGHGIITPSGTNTYRKKIETDIEVNAFSGYVISMIFLNGNNITPAESTGYYFLTVSEDTSLYVSFEPDQTNADCTVTKGSARNGSFILSSSGIVGYGTEITVTARPYTGYYIEGVYVNGDYIGDSTATRFIAVEDCTVYVNFERKNDHYDDDVETFTVRCTAGSNGSLSEDGDVEVEYGDELEIEIIPDIGYAVNTVYVDGSSKGSIKSYTFSRVRADHTIRATFKRDKNMYTITGNAGEGGYLNITEQEFEAGENFHLTITPYAGYSVQQVRIDGSNKGAIRSYDFDAIDKSHTVYAYFTRTDGTASAAPSGTNAYSGSAVLWVPGYGYSVNYPNTGSYIGTNTSSAVNTGSSIVNTGNTNTSSTGSSSAASGGTANAGSSSAASGSSGSSVNRASRSIPFYDVTVSDWYYEAVKYLYENSLIHTESGGNYFRPNENASRADLVEMIYDCEGSPVSDDTSVRFIDVSPGDRYFNAVKWAVDTGIVNGISEDRFLPGGQITREQIATIMYRYAYYKNPDPSSISSAKLSSFPDAEDVSGFAYLPVCWMVNLGLMQGNDAGYLNPLGTAARSELAQIIMRWRSDHM